LQTPIPLLNHPQEAIKLVTQQFVPFAGTLIYNGVAASATVLQL
jgi:hypothetical protein